MNVQARQKPVTNKSSDDANKEISEKAEATSTDYYPS